MTYVYLIKVLEKPDKVFPREIFKFKEFFL